MHTLVNGQLASDIPAPYRAANYGDGLFETMRYENGQIALCSYHLSRLELGLTRIAIDEDIQLISQEVDYFLQHLKSLNIQSGVIKLRVIRGGDTRGYLPDTNAEHWRIFEVFESLPKWGQEETAFICKHTLPIHPAFAGIKHLNRLDQVVAAQELIGKAVTTGLMLDSKQNLVCGIDSNIYLEMADRIITPLVQQSGVSGVFRRYIIDTMHSCLDIPLVEQDISLEQITKCDGLWLSNAVRGLRPVREVKGLASWQSPYSPKLLKLRSVAQASLKAGIS